MIIVKLWGGMCNQMFQYAFGYMMAKKYGDRLYFDVDFYFNQPGYVGRRKVISSKQFHNLSMLEFITRPASVKPFENKYVSHLIRYNIGCKLSIPFGVHLMMERLHKYYKILPYKTGSTNYYDGYWQTSKYFEEYEMELRYEFEPTDFVKQKVKMWRESITSNDCVAVHVRRGDYLNKVNNYFLNDGNVIGDSAYYMKAIDLLKEKIQNPVFCFFSDDITWCKETFSEKLANVVFVENFGVDAALVDLFSIAACEHGIMSPSTFSWWGNWLRVDKTDSIVVCPKGDYSNEFFHEGNWMKI